MKRVEASNAADILRSVVDLYLQYLMIFVDVKTFENPMLSIFSCPLSSVSKDLCRYFLSRQPWKNILQYDFLILLPQQPCSQVQRGTPEVICLGHDQ